MDSFVPQLPLVKIKRIMREDDATKTVGAEVNYLVAMATVVLLREASPFQCHCVVCRNNLSNRWPAEPMALPRRIKGKRSSTRISVR
jgi:hypothetical protein